MIAKGATIGFVGIGVMGKSMAGHLLAAGYRLQVFSRTKAKADALVASGARWCDSPAETAAGADVVITIVGYPADVEEVYFGAASAGILGTAKAGAILIDMTTSSPELAQRIAEAAHGRELFALDAPVSGGDVGAREARLSIMVGGDRTAFDACAAVFAAMGKNIVYQGPAGAGQHTKMCNQIAIASGMLGVMEALVYASRNQLDPATVAASIESGAAGSWSLSNLAPRVIRGDFNPGFFLKHFVKDMTIAQQSARAAGIKTPGLDTALSLYRSLEAEGLGDLGTQALYHWYNRCV